MICPVDNEVMPGSETVIPATGKHSFVWITDANPTETTEGSKHQECSVCHIKGATESIPKLPPTNPTDNTVTP